MGQQQLLFILLGIIVVGIAIAVSISLFRTSAIDSKRDILIDECSNLATMAMEYYRKPTSFGGGSNSFNGWVIPSTLQISANGSFQAEVEAGSILITGTGNEIATGTDSIKVEVTVLPTSFSTVIIN